MVTRRRFIEQVLLTQIGAAAPISLPSGNLVSGVSNPNDRSTGQMVTATLEPASPASGQGTAVDVASRVQGAIDDAHRSGGGVISLAPGKYFINGPVFLRSNTWLVGSGPGTQLLIGPRGEVGTASKEGVEGAGLMQLKFVNTDHSRPVDRAPVVIRSCGYSVFRDLAFEKWDEQTIVLIAPDNATGRQKNCVFNHFENWDVKDCRRGIWYRGLDDGSGGERYGRRLAVISNNTWINITLRFVKDSGIYAERWADTELYLKLFVQLTADHATAINLNPHPTQPWQIDRFCFVMPCLVYSASRRVTSISNPSTLTAIRLGPGVRGCSGWHIESDKVWNRTKLRGKFEPLIDNFLIDAGGDFYFFHVSHPGRGGRTGPRIYTKHFDRIDLGGLIIGADQAVEVKGVLQARGGLRILIENEATLPAPAVAGRGAVIGVRNRRGQIELRLSDGRAWTRFSAT
jgi:hypothetical protein